jgi:CRP-like cAMP-binding protein
MDATISTGNQLGIPQESCLLPEELEAMRAATHVVTFQKREVIFRQNTPVSHVLIVRSGLVKIYKEGRNKKNFILKQFSASAIETTEIGFVSLKSFIEVINKNGCFANSIIRSLSEEGLFIFERLIGQSHKQLPGRIADVILYFSDTIFKKEEFIFPFTRRELAELAGTTKESFIRTLSEFKNDKIISLDGSKVNINSMKIIRTLSELG